MTDLEIANSFQPERIEKIAAKLGLSEEQVNPYGKYKAKIAAPYDTNPQGKLILVTAVNPTPYGEGKTTISIGLAEGFRELGLNACLALREPSLGPVFGIKGGATGGGYSQIVPMADINLHFNGDFHAITAANNLLSALIDNHIKHGNQLRIEQVTHRRCMDMNDRALREITVSQGGEINGSPRSDGFNITAASEVMAVFCLAADLDDLKRRLGNIIIGFDVDGKTVFARDLHAEDAMAILLQEALYPNLVQTLNGTPTFVHGGPFANIAHGCNSVIATKTAMTYADYTVTEAGFGAELGAEKFFDIKCRKAGIMPSAVVLVATARALKYNGGADKNEVNCENLAALEKGLVNLEGHIENLKRFGLPITVAINRFITDTDRELALIAQSCQTHSVTAITANAWAEGGKGCLDLAKAVAASTKQPNNFSTLYPDTLSCKEKIESVAKKIYGAGTVSYSEDAEKTLQFIDNSQYKNFPVCIAKTQYSFSADAKLLGRPRDFQLDIKEIHISAGAEFIVAVCGSIMLMPGLPKVPNAVNMTIDNARNITGLF